MRVTGLLINPSAAEIKGLILRSRHHAARRIVAADGTVYVWPFESATHAEAAASLNMPYSLKPGAGDVLFIDA